MAHSRIRRYIRHGRLSHLAVFEASARLGCFSRAADELHLAQPTVSTQLRRLADALGVELFQQIGKRMHPTEAGRRVQAACADILGTLSRLEEELGSLRSLDSGRLSLAASGCAGRVAASFVARFARRHPALEVALHIDNRDALLERMRADADDLYLLLTPPEEGVVSQRILPYRLEVLAGADHRLARTRAIPFATVAAEPVVMREHGSGTRRVVEALYRERGFVPRVRLELPTSGGVEEAVSAGVGIAILPQLDEGEARRGVVALDVEGFPLQRHLSLSYPVGKALAPAARAFLDFARSLDN
jgi:LysR family transcriptional regulator, low CO2-responsive transcriptional regulator